MAPITMVMDDSHCATRLASVSASLGPAGRGLRQFRDTGGVVPAAAGRKGSESLQTRLDSAGRWAREGGLWAALTRGETGDR